MTKVKFGKSIFIRLVVTFFFIIIPIYALGIYIYNWGRLMVKNDLSKSIHAQVSFYLEGLEKEIERIKILQYDCLNDEFLNKLAVRWEIMDEYETTISIQRLQQRLVTIKNSSTYIKNVRVHILPIQKTISSNTGMDAIDMEKYMQIRVPNGLHGAQMISYQEGLFLSTLYQGNSQNQKAPYLIEIELNQEAFSKALAQFNNYPESSSYLISLTDSNIVMSSNDLPMDSIELILNTQNDKGVVINKHKYYIVNVKSDYLNIALINCIPYQYMLSPLQNFYAWVWVFSVTTMILILIYSFSTHRLIHKPLLSLMNGFREMENGNLSVTVHYDSNNEFGYLYSSFNRMAENLSMLIDQVYHQKILTQNAELKQLQSQISPHFLYNSFFIINTMARTGDENLIAFTKLLGEYFRFITRNASDSIPLLDEVNHARVYTDIQLMRFPKKLQILFAQCPEAYEKLHVPRLILQPIIENAFKHGIERKKDNGIISVNFEVRGNELNMIVEDNGTDMEDHDLIKLQEILQNKPEDLETTGMLNIHLRIRLVFGADSGLQVFRSELGGMKAILKIRLPEDSDNVQIIDS